MSKYTFLGGLIGIILFVFMALNFPISDPPQENYLREYGKCVRSELVTLEECQVIAVERSGYDE